MFKISDFVKRKAFSNSSVNCNCNRTNEIMKCHKYATHKSGSLKQASFNSSGLTRPMILMNVLQLSARATLPVKRIKSSGPSSF